MHKKILILFLFVLIALPQIAWFGGTLPALAEMIVDTAWVRRYNGPGNDYDEALAIAVDNSGNVYVTGASHGIGTDYDYCTIKYDTTGNELRVERYDGTGNGWDYAYAIALDDSGNVYVTGESYNSQTEADYTTIRYYPDLDTTWLRTYNGPVDGSDQTNALTVDTQGNVYVTGRISTVPV